MEARPGLGDEVLTAFSRRLGCVCSLRMAKSHVCGAQVDWYAISSQMVSFFFL